MELNRLLSQLIPRHYERASGEPLGARHICEAVVSYFPEGQPLVVHFDYDAANEGRNPEMRLGRPDASTFNHRPVNRAPYVLEWDEAFVVHRAKRRRVLVLTKENQAPGGLKKEFPPALLCCPMYRFKDTHPEDFRLRVKAMEYAELVYLPADEELDIREGFARLDRVLSIPKGHLKATGVRLTEDAWFWFQERVRWFLTGTLDETLAGIRAQLRQAVT